MFRRDGGADREQQVGAFIALKKGRVLSSSRIDAVAYHALLAEVPVSAVREIVQLSAAGIAGLEPVMAIRPQSIASSIEIHDSQGEPAPLPEAALGSPIAALIDGVPIAGHRLLRAHLVVEDRFGLEPLTGVDERKHGAAMASLIVHGDRNQPGPVLPRKIHVVPVLGPGDRFPNDRLPVDLVYAAVQGICDGDAPSAPGTLIINLSLGNTRRPFQGQLSPWARLLDYLAFRHGLLFVVSAGNWVGAFPVRGFATKTAYEDADATHRAKETLRAIGGLMAERRLLSPAETVNGLTVGACNADAVAAATRQAARANVDPYGSYAMLNPSSALGPSFGGAVKPEVLAPGGREHLRFQTSGDGHLEMRPADAGRYAGLQVAAPPRTSLESSEAFTSGSSAAAALTSRSAHRIHDALEATYGEEFTELPKVQRAVLLKALASHPAKWPEDTAALIRGMMGPANGRLHVQQKDNVRRFLGYGIVDAEDAVGCATDRATSGSADPWRRRRPPL